MKNFWLAKNELKNVKRGIVLHSTSGHTIELIDEPVVKFRGKFQEANALNINKRLYPFEVLENSIKCMEKNDSSK